MLINRQDIIAASVGASYAKDASKDLLVFALRNNNEQFLKFAFRKVIFSA